MRMGGRLRRLLRSARAAAPPVAARDGSPPLVPISDAFESYD